MYPFVLLNCILAILTRAHAAPRPDTLATPCPQSNASSLSWPATASSAATPGPGADGFFQCVTNPNCEHCRIETPTTSTAPASSSPKTPTSAANATSVSVTNYRTMPPGTYTVTTNGTVLDIVVTQETATPTSSQALVTTTETVVITVRPVSTATTSKTSPTATSDHDCAGRCDCSRVEDKNSKEFFECLTSPDCEHCRSANAVDRATETSASGVVSTTPTASGGATTSFLGVPTDACPQFCDCSSIEDKESEV
ncbi:uncharacterized protein MAM_06621 [Metarhizium album ARSEF 1941]|uniref:Ham1-like protein n=1 Tax=Metarhizium album (strain ARSEF 1941) TaxID=1081103 RepID=A0A0B2WPJ4_METAS|nr:uncharacterized protein MAM_06621 [Metarhizium album ARSEF 1941]KHN95564.1 hypothetical protein MAM_06621 [Metarhizium album ARSEF 1941]